MEIKQHSWVGNGAFRMWCEPLVENYWMSSEGLTQEFSPADTANIKKTLQRCARLKDVNDLQAWQVSLRAKTLRNPVSLMNRLLDPRFTSCDLRVYLRQWKRDANKHEAKTGRTISDHISGRIYLNRKAPLKMRHRLMLNPRRLDTAEAISEEIEEYCEAVKGFITDSKKPPGCVAPVMETGVAYNGGKRAARKGKETRTRDLDISLRAVSSESVAAAAIGVGELATKRFSVG